MSTRTTTGASAAVAALLLSAVAPTAQAAGDTSPPEFVSFEVSPTVVDAREGGDVTATLHITDETCLDESALELGLRTTDGSGYGEQRPATRIAGDCTDGIYETSFPVSGEDLGLEPFGPWSVIVHPLSDTVGNAAEPGHPSFFRERYFTYAASPDAATDLVVTEAGTTALSASWTAPEANGSPIMEYVVRVKDATGTTVLTESVDDPVVDGLSVSLAAGQEYSFEVTAHNLVGGTETATTSFVPQAAGYTPPAESPFVDITPTTTFYKEMAWMAENKISGGWSTDAGKVYRPHTA
ncbi:fibronectin type III domain-containing protein, partial [Kocuria sp. M1R5S2]|uniref:fibronectin type III domain-containing protein n=1 Tax=Kocuria rhizosphaerae TaxID=3376285 RepID=UPI00378CE519